MGVFSRNTSTLCDDVTGEAVGLVGANGKEYYFAKSVPGVFTVATLPPATRYEADTLAYTTDAGPVYSNGAIWVALGSSTVSFDDVLGSPYDNAQLLAALGGVDLGGPSDASDPVWSETPGPDLGRAMSYKMDGITWVIDWHDDGRPNTETCGDLVRLWVYDGQLRPIGVNGPHFQGGALVLTYAQMIALVPTVSGLKVKLTDAYPGMEFIYDQPNAIWMSPSGVIVLGKLAKPRLVVAGTATYSRAGNVVTVVKTAHGMSIGGNNNAFNGAEVNLPASTGGLLAGWYTNFTWIDANTFTCVDQVASGTITSNTLGTNIAETVVFETVVKAKMTSPTFEAEGHVIGVCSGVANNKTFRVKWGGTNVWNPTLTVNRLVQPARISIHGFGATNKQVGYSTASTSQSGDGNNDMSIYGADTQAGDVVIQHTVQCANAADWAGFVAGAWAMKQ